MTSRTRLIASLAASATLAIALTGCSPATTDAQPSRSASAAPAELTTVRLGYFPNLTHAPALVGTQQGLFKNALKELGLTVTPTVFNAGPDAVTALFASSLDCTYIGPNPAVNAYVQSNGEAIRVVAGSTSSGAALVVRPEIQTIDDMKGKSFATPQLGNTQDVAFRYWLKEQGIETTPEGGGEVSIKPQANAEGLAAYAAGDIDGAWVPEPWVSEYIAQGARIFLDEAELWPNGEFVTTHIICRSDFVRDYPEVVTALLQGHLAALDSIANDPVAAKASFSLALSALTGSAPKAEILDRAWRQVRFTPDPLADSLVTSAEDAVAVGLLNGDALEAAGGLPGSLYDLTLLNAVLTTLGRPTIGE